MAHIFLSDLKTTLDNCIAELEEIHFMFCKNPESDFTRNRKLSFHDYIQLMLQMQSKSVSNEILDFYEHSLSAPSKSAFTQQRYKLQPEGWNFLFHAFAEQCRALSDNLYHGYRLLACDGSDVNITRNPFDERTFAHLIRKGMNFESSGFVLITEPISVLQPIFRKKIFRWKKSKSFTGCAGVKKQVSANW